MIQCFIATALLFTLTSCAGPVARHDIRTDRRYDAASRVDARQDYRYERRYDRRKRVANRYGY